MITPKKPMCTNLTSKFDLKYSLLILKEFRRPDFKAEATVHTSNHSIEGHAIVKAVASYYAGKYLV